MAAVGPLRQALGPHREHDECAYRRTLCNHHFHQLAEARVGPLVVIDQQQTRFVILLAQQQCEQLLECPAFLQRRGELRSRVARVSLEAEEIEHQGHGVRQGEPGNSEASLERRHQARGIGVARRRADLPPEIVPHRVQHAILVIGVANEFGDVGIVCVGHLAFQFVCQARLADAALAGDDDNLALSVARLCPALFQHRQFRLASDQCRQAAAGLQARATIVFAHQAIHRRDQATGRRRLLVEVIE